MYYFEYNFKLLNEKIRITIDCYKIIKNMFKKKFLSSENKLVF